MENWGMSGCTSTIRPKHRNDQANHNYNQQAYPYYRNALIRRYSLILKKPTHTDNNNLYTTLKTNLCLYHIMESNYER